MEISIIWENLNKDLRSFIFSKVKDEGATDDILQDLYIKIHENLCGLKDNKKLKSWIYQITRNLINDHFRQHTKSLTIKEIRQELSFKQSQNRFMDSAIRDMVEIMDDLPPEYCEALCMTELEGMSQKEYALLKGISYSGAKSRVQRARTMLRELLLRCCHYYFDKYGTVYNIQQKCCCC